MTTKTGNVLANHPEHLVDDDDDGARLSARLIALEREVAVGLRDARSLVVWPESFAARATLTFPADAFGKPADW